MYYMTLAPRYTFSGMIVTVSNGTETFRAQLLSQTAEGGNWTAVEDGGSSRRIVVAK